MPKIVNSTNSPSRGRTTTRTPTLSVRATITLRRMILEGEVLPGHALSEAELSEELGMSKTPLREALRILSIDGLVTHSSFRTWSVRRLSEHDVENIFQIRLALEPFAIELACRQQTDARTDILRQRLEDARSLARPGGLSLARLNRTLHRELIEDCGNEELLKIFDSYNERLTLAVLQGWLREDTSVEEFNEHQQIVEAFVDHDAATVERLMRDHIAKAKENFAQR